MLVLAGLCTDVQFLWSVFQCALVFSFCGLCTLKHKPVCSVFVVCVLVCTSVQFLWFVFQCALVFNFCGLCFSVHWCSVFVVCVSVCTGVQFLWFVFQCAPVFIFFVVCVSVYTGVNFFCVVCVSVCTGVQFLWFVFQCAHSCWLPAYQTMTACSSSFSSLTSVSSMRYVHAQPSLFI